MRSAAAVVVWAAVAWAADPAVVKPVDPATLPASLQATAEWIAKINRETEARIREGEADHLIFFALQSKSFTALEPIEPARSSREWHEAGKIPEDAAKRMAAFRAAGAKGPRHEYFAKMLAAGFDLDTEYARAMRFLYEKEWASRARSGDERRDFIAGLYQTRGHSTDTNLTANYAVHMGLEALQKRAPGTKIRRVLLIGPGLDWAPRTGLRDEEPPQSYQPYALADSLVRLGLSDKDTLRIDAADVNPRVVAYLAAFPDSARRLWLRYATGDEPWNRYFDGLGKEIGVRGEQKGVAVVDVSAAASRLVQPLRLNVLTQRVTPGGQYDLVVATNVLLYFEDRELQLALANVADALAAGGYFLHNDTRGVVERFAAGVGLPIVDARMVRLDLKRPVYDAAVVHRRGNGAASVEPR